MEKSIERRITLQPYQSLTHLQLTQFPLGNLQNPGIGVKLFDVMLPLHGIEKFEVLKTESVVPGSFEDKPENSKKEIKQLGFGQELLEPTILENKEKLEKLGPIYEAMQKASIKKSTFKFMPKKTQKNKKNVVKKHKFSFL